MSARRRPPKNKSSQKNSASNSVLPSFPKCYKKNSKPHKFCPGCGHPIVLKMLGQAIDELKIQNKSVFLIDIGCSLLAWDFYNIDTTQTHHGRTIPVALGFKRANPEAVVIAYLGDGGAYSIGMQHLVHATLRNENITTIVVNNMNYGMTGGQMAPTTITEQPPTTTAPFGRKEKYLGTPLKGPEMLEKIGVPGQYIARMSVDVPPQLKLTLKKALQHQMDKKGFSFVEALSYCPNNWKTNAAETIATLQKAKQEFPTYEKEL
ncbi:2-oxoglutarate synthase [Candidatus Dojkabacteria bacterium]|nr:2-oxoglutarate synthase [Candidatus Dojkabacteria bacterium]